MTCICSDGKARCDCGLCSKPFPDTIPWPPRRASAQTECAAQEGGEFHAPAPARVPRHQPLFKTPEQMREEGFEPAGKATDAGFTIGAFVGSIVLVLGCWGIVQFIVAIVRAAP